MAYALDHIINRRSQYINAWKENAEDAVFWGMTLEQFKAATAESERLRDEIRKMEAGLVALRMQRDQADQAGMVLMDHVANSVRGTPGFGNDSSLYSGLGYVPQSQRKTGLVRKFKKPREKKTGQ